MQPFADVQTIGKKPACLRNLEVLEEKRVRRRNVVPSQVPTRQFLTILRAAILDINFYTR